MSNSYLCDGCWNSCPTLLTDRQRTRCDITYCFERGVMQKIVLPDGYQGDPKKLCAQWKEMKQ